METGALSNQRVFADHCFPDGITVDATGNVWNTFCRRGEPLQVFNTEGNCIAEYYLPVHRVISAAFGGPENRSVFVSTAHENNPGGKHDGGIFVLKTDVAGCEEYIFYTDFFSGSL